MNGKSTQSFATGRASLMPAAQSSISELLATATVLHRQQQLLNAELYYKAVLKQQPTHFDALLCYGVSLIKRKQCAGAIAILKQAVKVNPSSADAHATLGRAYKEHGQHRLALRCMQRVLEIRPDSAEIYNECGILMIALGDSIQALECYQRALAIRPDYVEALYNSGNALVKLNRHAEALVRYDRVLAIRPTLVDALHNRGNVLRELQRYREALPCYEQAIRYSPQHLAAQLGCAKMLELLYRPDAALERYRFATKLAPDSAEGWYGWGAMLQRLGKYEEAAHCYAQTLLIKSDFPGAASMLAFVNMCCCNWNDRKTDVERVRLGVGARRALTLPWLLFSVSDSAADHLECARHWSATYFPVAPTPLWRGENYRHTRIRVAYLSADFHMHATTHLMAGMFEHHDRVKFETVAISFGPAIEDAMRSRLHLAFDKFIDVSARSDLDIARLLREMEIDIAVDLKGYTTDSRSGILTHRPAPVQASYLGYPGTMGTSSIDYIVADEIIIPPDERQHYSEKIVYLPDCYQANDNSRSVSVEAITRAEAGLPDSGFVFCCFNNNFKITPDVFDVWTRLLQVVEDSVLWLLEDNPVAAKNLRLEASRRGIASERLVFAPRVTPEKHLARHSVADLFLDTLPCNAHTTASDALWAGLPIVTCIGKTFAGRVGASLLHAARIPELVATSMQEYEALALALATDPGRLAELRARLVGGRHTIPLFDTEKLTRNVERAYIAMLTHKYNEPQIEGNDNDSSDRFLVV